MKYRGFTLIYRLVLFVLAFCISGCAEKPKVISFSGQTMGTSYHIKVVPSDNYPDRLRLKADVDRALELVNDQMSTYRSASELSRFNQMPSGSMVVSKDTATVIAESIRLYKITNGTLDVTVGPLVNLWGFGPDQRPTKIPEKTEIQLLKSKTGIQHLKLSGQRLTKKQPHVYVDLSSIAKGFGVDKVAQLLESLGSDSYMVEIGGEVKTKGAKSDGQPWRIAIERPQDGQRDVALVIEPHDLAVATSGDYRNFYEQDGKRLSHLIDPRTGYPITHKLASVTVMHQSCMIADALATAMIVMGTEEAFELAQSLDLAVMLIEKDGDTFNTHYSPAFKKLMK